MAKIKGKDRIFLQRMWLRNTQMDGTVSRLSSVEYDDRGEGKSGV